MIPKFFRIFHLLSFDVAIGAIICQRYFAALLDVEISWIPGFVLGICVLLIYNIDHLIDSRAGVTDASRRVFYRRNTRSILIFCLTLLTTGFLLLFILDREVLLNGFYFSGLCGGYLVMVYFIPSLWIKEMLVAVCYTIGVLLAPVSMAQTITMNDISIFLQFGSLAFINLLIFSWYDLENDLAGGFSSLVVKLGKQRTVYLLEGLFMVFLLFTGFTFQYDPVTQGVFLLMAGVLMSLIFFQENLRKNDLYRILGDAVFFIPMIRMF